MRRRDDTRERRRTAMNATATATKVTLKGAMLGTPEKLRVRTSVRAGIIKHWGGNP
jgi:hypothetical protein